MNPTPRHSAILPPTWRVRKDGESWTVLRIQPVRHFIYFPVKDGFATAEEAWHWICVRTGLCEPDGTIEESEEELATRETARKLLTGE